MIFPLNVQISSPTKLQIAPVGESGPKPDASECPPAVALQMPASHGPAGAQRQPTNTNVSLLDPASAGSEAVMAKCKAVVGDQSEDVALLQDKLATLARHVEVHSRQARPYVICTVPPDRHLPLESRSTCRYFPHAKVQPIGGHFPHRAAVAQDTYSRASAILNPFSEPSRWPSQGLWGCLGNSICNGRSLSGTLCLDLAANTDAGIGPGIMLGSAA